MQTSHNSLREEVRRGVFERHDRWYVTLGNGTVAIPQRLGQNISFALRAQQKVEEALVGLHRPGFLKTIAMMNCRKSAFAVLEEHPLKNLVLGRNTYRPDASRETIDQMSGIPELLSDVDAILQAHRMPVLGTADSMQIAEYLDSHSTEIPAVVHVFNVKKPYVSEVISKIVQLSGGLTWKDVMSKMNRDHTFIVLGKDASGEYICFHKRGPSLHHPFELVYLDAVLSNAIDPRKGVIYTSLIRPAATGVSQEDSETLTTEVPAESVE